MIGWDFADKPLAIPGAKTIYILDLPVDRVFGFNFADGESIPPAFAASGSLPNIIWIDHHKSSIETHPTNIPGYRIDGVAACRLAWQWFTHPTNSTPRRDPEGNALLPLKEEYIARKVSEPDAVRLAGEYDIWDKRNPNAEVFQFGLRSIEMRGMHWECLLDDTPSTAGLVNELLQNGHLLQRYQQQTDAGVVSGRSFLVEFEGLKFLALNTARCNSLTFAAKDVPETGHEALMGFYWNGTAWNVSLYHANHRKDLDLSAIAVRYGGGGHRGACGFRLQECTGMIALLLGMPPVEAPKTFEQEIRECINRHSMENASNTPDFILACYLLDTLQTFNRAVKHRAYWHGHEVQPVPGNNHPVPGQPEGHLTPALSPKGGEGETLPAQG